MTRKAKDLVRSLGTVTDTKVRSDILRAAARENGVSPCPLADAP